MHPPLQRMDLDVEAISSILGSISIACWVVVFTPQIVENFQRSSAEGLSVVFVVVWLAGDVFNILGSVLQGVLPTMIVLAIYYTIADAVLIAQVFYYRGFTLTDEIKKTSSDIEGVPSESDTLLRGDNEIANDTALDMSRTRSRSAFHDHFASADAVHFSPVTPLHSHPAKSNVEAAVKAPPRSQSTLRTVLKNTGAILIVCIAGIVGWYISSQTSRHGHQSGGDTERERHDTLEFNVLGQVFGYICALLYLGSRIPQLLLNYRRKSTEGLSLLFFLFACVGNATYVLSILAYEPACASKNLPRDCTEGEALRDYGRNVLVNLSWLLGSLGTLFLDGGVFVQYFLYRPDEDDEDEDDEPNNTSYQSGYGTVSSLNNAEDASRARSGEERGRSTSKR